MRYEQVNEAVKVIESHTTLRPTVAVILGSGLGDLATTIEQATAIPYAEIPHFARSTVTGHAGRLLIGTIETVPVVMMQGRFHFYEGYSPQVLAFPIRVMAMLGAQTLLVTNAAGGVNPAYKPGDLMLIRNHINLPGLAGANPLIGENDERFGPRFPALARPYDTNLRTLARSVAQHHTEITLHEGIYTMVAGPSFETQAELKYLRLIGTDAVGMSTAPEVVVARHMGMRVLGISLITNTATGDEPEEAEANHNEVLTVANAARVKFVALVRGIMRQLADSPSHPIS